MTLIVGGLKSMDPNCCRPAAYGCSAAPRPHAVLAVHLFLFLNGFKHEGSARFGSWRQTAVFVFIRSARRAQQPASSSNLVPLLGVWWRQTVSREKATQALPGTKKKCPAREKSHELTCRTAVAAALRVLFAVVAIEIILAGRTCVYCWGENVGVRERLHFISPEGKHVSAEHWANLNNCVTTCWWQLPPSESLLCERKVVFVVVGKLWFLQRQGSFSSGNRSWSTRPDKQCKNVMSF